MFSFDFELEKIEPKHILMPAHYWHVSTFFATVVSQFHLVFVTIIERLLGT